MTDYLVGDMVIHANYGLGEIIEIDEKFIHERQRLCYVVRTQNLTVWVNADEPGQSTIRLPTPEADFEALFVILCDTGASLPDDTYQRKSLLAQQMKDGELASVCSVIRDLSFFQKSKKLNYSDHAIMDRAQDFLLAEWVYSRSVTRAQAQSELTSLLTTGFIGNEKG